VHPSIPMRMRNWRRRNRDAPLLLRRRGWWFMHFCRKRFDHFESAALIVNLHRHTVAYRQMTEEAGLTDFEKDRLIEIGFQYTFTSRHIKYCQCAGHSERGLGDFDRKFGILLQ